MHWLSALFTAVLTAAFAGLGSGIVAGLAVDWYRVSSFEGGSGYFVVFIALGGLLGGLVVGGACAAWLGDGQWSGFGRGLGMAWLIVTGLCVIVGGAARWQADVPPTLDGERLMLRVELRWPASQRTAPRAGAVAPVLELGALAGNTQRVSKQGPLWMEDAHLQDGRWVVPGAVEIFTNRGTRVLRADPAFDGLLGLRLPMSGSPRAQDREWSDWLPRDAPDGFGWRYRVLLRSEASRTEAVGPFEVDTIADAFFVGDVRNGSPVMVATAEFRLRHRGQPVMVDEINKMDASNQDGRVQAVATLPGTPTALLLRRGSECWLLRDDAGTPRSERVARCDGLMTAEPLTNDGAWREAAKAIRPVQGRIDRESFMHPGHYLFADAVFDAATRRVRPFDSTEPQMGIDRSIGAIGLSPDGLSFVRLGFSETEYGAPALLVVDTATKTPALLPVDRRATRYAGPDSLTPQWLAHYYAWQRDAGGRDRLAKREGVAPLPYRGALHTESSGSVVYQVQPSGQPMAEALVAFIVSELSNVGPVRKTLGGGFEMKVGAVQLHVFVNDNDHQAVAYVADGADNALVGRIAQGFDAVLATGRHDALFEWK